MVKPYLLCPIAMILLAAVLLAAETIAVESGEWTKITIKEAFISRQTSIDFSDPNSAPEFGWQLKCGEAFAARGRSLYATMYAPCSAAEPLRLYLMELDIFSDDIVSGVPLEREKSKFVLNGNGDFAVLESTPFYPDARSGGDAQPAGAGDLTGDRRDSVSFLDGDRTDCYRLPAGVAGAIIIATSPSLFVDLPVIGMATIHPWKKTITAVTIVESGRDGAIVRLRGATAFGRVEYSISPFTKGTGPNGAMQKSLKHIPGEKTVTRSFLCKDLARALISLDREETLGYCAKAAGTNPANEESAIDCLCSAVRLEGKVPGGPERRR